MGWMWNCPEGHTDRREWRAWGAAERRSAGSAKGTKNEAISALFCTLQEPEKVPLRVVK
jgi:hypothetical protein